MGRDSGQPRAPDGRVERRHDGLGARNTPCRGKVGL